MIYLVACTRKKGNIPTAAGLLYQSTWFSLAKKYVGGNTWYILSAKHGLIAPDVIISPYDMTLNTKPRTERYMWAQNTVSQILKLDDTDYTILAGRKYTEFIVPMLVDNNYNVLTPLQGMGIGRQQKYFKEHTK